MTRLRAIVADARPAAVLTTSALLRRRRRDGPRACPELAGLPDGRDRRGRRRRSPTTGATRASGRETLAFLQYTSGSTGDAQGGDGHPRQPAAQLGPDPRAASARPPESRGVFWLPLFHDMGLIGGVLQTLYCGGTQHAALARRLPPAPAPLARGDLADRGDDQRRARTSPTTSASARSTPEQRAGLDLSRWAVAFNGAEPVRAETLDRFAEAFAPCGFRREAFLPCYGLAEATLLVSGGPPGRRPVVFAGRAPARSGRAESADAADRRTPGALVGCGRASDGPGGRDRRPRDRRRAARTAGSARSGSRAERRAGYWGRPEATGRDLRRHARRTGDGPVPADRRPRLPPRRRAVRHRPAQGPDHRPRPERLPAGHRVDRRAAPPRAPGRRGRGVLGRGRRARSGWSSSTRSSGLGKAATAERGHRGDPPGGRRGARRRRPRRPPAQGR